MTETTTPPPLAPPPATEPELDVDATAAPPESTENPPQRERVRDPNLSVLQGMFPDFDETLLQSVLDSVGGNSDRAIDVLLGMSDPDFRGDARPHDEPVLSQEELDARFARQLLLDEQQQYDAAWQAQQQSRPRPTFSGRRQTQPPPETERDTMAEIGEQFNKIAETGKKTFGNIFSKVKAKIQEFDQSRQEGGSSASGDYEARQSSYATAASQPATNRHQRMQEQLEAHQARQQQNQQPAYYDPNGGRESPPSSAGGYDVTPVVSQPTTPRSPPPSSGIDAGKLGLLPKRPVSLLRAQSPPTSPPADGGFGHPTKILTSTAEQPSAGAPVQAVRHNSDADDLYLDDDPANEDPFEDAHEGEAEAEIRLGTTHAPTAEPKEEEGVVAAK